MCYRVKSGKGQFYPDIFGTSCFLIAYAVFLMIHN